MVLSIQTEIYLIRHGLAAERGTYTNDDERPLTDSGRKKTRQVAERLQHIGLSFETLLSSPLVRAQQTASILVDVGLAHQVEVSTTLAPDGSLQSWLSWLAEWQRLGHQRLALVGHEPDLSTWAQQLVIGQSCDRWTLKKAGIIGLKVPAANQAIGHSHLIWLTPPRFFL